MVGLAVRSADSIKCPRMMFANAVEIYECKWIKLSIQHSSIVVLLESNECIEFV